MPYKQTPGGSYSKDCDFCGRRIQMRKMGPGHYVAFEGQDNVHQCQHPPGNKFPLWTWPDDEPAASIAPKAVAPRDPNSLPPLRADFTVNSASPEPSSKPEASLPKPPSQSLPWPATPRDHVQVPTTRSPEPTFEPTDDDEIESLPELRSDFESRRSETRPTHSATSTAETSRVTQRPTAFDSQGTTFHRRAAYSFEPAISAAPHAARSNLWKWIVAGVFASIAVGGVVFAQAARNGAVGPLGGTCPPGFPIKGNINTSGQQIYHVPGGAFYDTTRPERCFRNSAAAEAGGFRPSQR